MRNIKEVSGEVGNGESQPASVVTAPATEEPQLASNGKVGSGGHVSDSKAASPSKDNGRDAPNSEDTGAAAAENGGSKGDKPKLPRPTGIQPCPRCGSDDTKFCYYNNYNIKQPRYYCKGCQRYWTAGGALRDVPVGAGRRKNKATKSQDGLDSMSGGMSPVPLSMLAPSVVMDSALAMSMGAAAAAMPPPMIPPMLPPGMPLPAIPPVLPHVPFPPVNALHHPAALGGSMTKVTANALLPEAAPFPGAAGAQGVRPSGTVNQPESKSAEVTEDGAIDGRRTRQRTDERQVESQEKSDGPGRRASPSPPQGANAAAQHSGMATVPTHPAEWFAAAASNPQAVAAMHAQFQAAAAAGCPPPFGMPGMSMWPYGAFPPSWPGTYPRVPPSFPALDANSRDPGNGSSHSQGGPPTQPFMAPPTSYPGAPMMPPMPWPGVMAPGGWPSSGFPMPVAPVMQQPTSAVPPVPSGSAAALPESRAMGPMVPNHVSGPDGTAGS